VYHAAHRVQLELIEDEQQVRVTLHERAGDVSIRIESDSETLRTELQSAVGVLIEGLRREQVSLSNLDFAMMHPDDNQGQQQPSDSTPRPKPARRLARAYEQPAEADTVNIRKIF
jgi:hypothetical protein